MSVIDDLVACLSIIKNPFLSCNKSRGLFVCFFFRFENLKFYFQFFFLLRGKIKHMNAGSIKRLRNLLSRMCNFFISKSIGFNLFPFFYFFKIKKFPNNQI